MWADEIRKFGEAKAQYIRAHGGKKRTLEAQIQHLKLSIASWTHHGQGVCGFDWAVEFAEVFRDGGFDIAVANPPYVRMELFKAQKPILRANFPSVHAERADLYCYFYARSLELLKTGGMLSFISPNKWFRANYGAPLRALIAKTCEIQCIVDFGELPIFKAATFPMIFIARKGTAHRGSLTHTSVRTLDPPYPDVLALVQKHGSELPNDCINGSTWTLSEGSVAERLRKMESAGGRLGEYVKGQILYGVKTGLNSAFVIDSDLRRALILANPKCGKFIKKWVVGDDVRRWRIDASDNYIIYLHHGVDVRSVPELLDHLRPFRSQLLKRATRQEWYELQQPQFNYTSAFASPKILFPDIAKESRFTIDEGGCYPANTVYFVASSDLFLLGVLNSKCVWDYCKEHLTVLGDAEKGGRLRFFRQFVEKIPIPKATEKEKRTIAELTSECLRLRGKNCAELEEQLDKRVITLYGLDPA